MVDEVKIYIWFQVWLNFIIIKKILKMFGKKLWFNFILWYNYLKGFHS
jgi:hypothetical protein